MWQWYLAWLVSGELEQRRGPSGSLSRTLLAVSHCPSIWTAWSLPARATSYQSQVVSVCQTLC